MKLFFIYKEIVLKKKRIVFVVIGIGLVIGIYLIVFYWLVKMLEFLVVVIVLVM